MAKCVEGTWSRGSARDLYVRLLKEVEGSLKLVRDLNTSPDPHSITELRKYYGTVAKDYFKPDDNLGYYVVNDEILISEAKENLQKLEERQQSLLQSVKKLLDTSLAVNQFVDLVDSAERVHDRIKSWRSSLEDRRATR